jgi:hypothetical protein
VLDLVQGLEREPDPVAAPQTLPVIESLPPPGRPPSAAVAQPPAAGPTPQAVARPMARPEAASLPDLTYRLHP